METKNIIDTLNEIKNNIKITKGFLFNKSNAQQNIDVIDNKLDGILKINDFEIKLYEYQNEDEKKEINNCEIYKRIILREDSIRCLLYSMNDEEENITIEGKNITLKIDLIKNDNIAENIDILLTNIDDLIDFEAIEDNEDSKYLENLIRNNSKFSEKRLYALEIKNINTFLETTQKNDYENALIGLIRTNLLLTNETNGCKFFLFNPELFKKESKSKIKNIDIHPKPFVNELLYYFESAQKIPFNHIKYLEYYHVIEFFSMKQALKDQEKNIKNLVNIYFQGKDYMEMASSVKELSESLKNPVESKYIKQVILKIPYKDIVKMINDNDLIKPLRKNYFSAPSIAGKIEITKNLIEEPEEKMLNAFWDSVFNRIYKIRNIIVHSSTKDIINAERFSPNEENLQKLEPDLKFIKFIAYEIAKLESN